MPKARFDPWRNSSASSLGELQECLSIYCQDSKEWLFRGQSVIDYPLPRFYRSNPPKADLHLIESSQIADFRKTLRCTESGVLESDWDVLTLLQHYHGRTRLLDWTSDYLVALWFALDGRSRNLQEQVNKTHKAVVWLVRPNLQVREDFPSTPLADLKSIEFFRPKALDARVVAQASVLSAHPLPKSRLSAMIGFHEDWESLRKANGMFQIQIPDSALNDMRIALEKIGISKEFIYPNVARSVERYNLQYDQAPALQHQMATSPVRMSWRDK